MDSVELLWFGIVDAGSRGARERLLASQYFPGHGWLTVTAEEHGASFTHLERTSCLRLNGPLLDVLPQCFMSHHILDLPDIPPVANSNSMTTSIHEFILEPTLTTLLNTQLRCREHFTALLEAQQGGLKVSNANGGLHTLEEEWVLDETALFGSGDDGGHPWYARLDRVVRTALSVILGRPFIASITGWLNASPPTGFNSLHDHGDSSWSAVYFIDDGSSTSGGKETTTTATIASDGCPRSMPGSLLIRTQLEPYTQKFGYFEVPPRPGTLVLFPGYTPHAVLPRSIEGDGCGVQSTGLRISAACNILIKPPRC